MKRRRPILSCSNCRARRIRCDKVRPICGRCRAAGQVCEYIYATEVEGEGGTLSAEASLEQPGPSGRDSDPDTTETNTPQPDSLPPFQEGTLVPESEGRSQYFGPTFWGSAILSNLTIEDRGYFLTQRQPHWLQRSGADNSIWRRAMSDNSFESSSSNNGGFCRFCGENYTLNCCLAVLPTKTICDKLVGAFFSNVYPLIPILHVPSVVADHKSFWDQFSQQNKHSFLIGTFLRRRPDFICLLFAMIFAGLSTIRPSQTRAILGGRDKLIVRDMYFATMQSASLVGFPRRPSLYSLAAYMIAESQFMREEDFPDPPIHIGTAFRVALSMGLHLKSNQFEFGEAEARRRLWWFIIHIDVMTSASSGLSPLFIDEEMANADMITSYDAASERFEFNDIQDVRYVVAKHRYSISKTLRVIIRRHFERKLQSDEGLRSAAAALHVLATEIRTTNEQLLPEDFRMILQSTANEDEMPPPLKDLTTILDQDWKLESRATDLMTASFCSWAAVLLHLMIHKAYCVLYHPFVKSRSTAATVSVSIRDNAVKHAQAFIHLFLAICAHPASLRFHWMYPGTYQPLHPLSVLLADLLQYPHSDEATASRGLVDAIFDLYQVDHGVISRTASSTRSLSTAGKGAWWMLIKARTKALDAVNQDPHVLLPHQPSSHEQCICGQPIGAKIRRDSSPDLPTFSDIFHPPAQVDPNVQSLQQQELSNFDWETWDELLGEGTGFLG